jgi:hypothetical protein
MSEEEDQTLCVGVELIAQGGVAVSVRGNNRGANIQDDGVLCVWLAGAGCGEREVKLLMPTSLYSPAATLDATLYDRKYRLTPLRLLEAGPDYELGLFKVARRTEHE